MQGIVRDSIHFDGAHYSKNDEICVLGVFQGVPSKLLVLKKSDET